MKRSFLLPFLVCLCFQKGKAQSSFVSVKQSRFYTAGHPYYFVGTNYWYGGLLALQKDKQRGIDRLRKELDFLQLNGIKNVRVLAGSEGEGLINGVFRVGPALQTAEGVFDPDFLNGLDELLYELGKRKMTAVIYLSNNWNWSGGFLQYLKWNGEIPDSFFEENISWNETGKYTSKFYSCKVAVFTLSLKDKNQVPIPVILRLFHELNGNWFWWGKDHCTPEDFKKLWQFTISYLRDTKNVHQLLYAYNTDKFFSKEEYLLKYPGDEYVDVLGFDIYQRNKGDEGNNEFIKNADTMLTMIDDIAFERNKIPALTEFGFVQLPDSTWFTNVLLKAFDHHKISYALAWRNAGYKPSGEVEYYLPFKGNPVANDFIKFYNDPTTLFQKEVTKQYLYK